MSTHQRKEASPSQTWDYYIDKQLGSMALDYKTFMTQVFNNVPYPQMPEGRLTDTLEQRITAGTLGFKATANGGRLLGRPDIFETKSA